MEVPRSLGSSWGACKPKKSEVDVKWLMGRAVTSLWGARTVQGNEMTLSAKLDPGSGELVWVMEPDEKDVERQYWGESDDEHDARHGKERRVREGHS